MNCEPLAVAFTTYASAKLREHFAQIRRCTALLTDAEVWHRINAHTNSIGNLILHLTGNVRQWIVAGLGGEPFDRDRPAEFAARGPLPSARMIAELERVVRRAIDVIGHLDDAALAATRQVQGYEVSGLIAVFHVVEHFAGHTAQIVHMTKALRDRDLSAYDAQGRKQSGDKSLP